MSGLSHRLNRLEKTMTVQDEAKADAAARDLERDLSINRRIHAIYGPKQGEPGYTPPELVGPIDRKKLNAAIERAYGAKEA